MHKTSFRKDQRMSLLVFSLVCCWLHLSSPLPGMTKEGQLLPSWCHKAKEAEGPVQPLGLPRLPRLPPPPFPVSHNALPPPFSRPGLWLEMNPYRMCVSYFLSNHLSCADQSNTVKVSATRTCLRRAQESYFVKVSTISAIFHFNAILTLLQKYHNTACTWLNFQRPPVYRKRRVSPALQCIRFPNTTAVHPVGKCNTTRQFLRSSCCTVGHHMPGAVRPFLHCFTAGQPSRESPESVFDASSVNTALRNPPVW